MKFRFLTLLSAVSVLFTFTFGLTACGGEKDIHNHNFGEWETVLSPTCTEEGEKRRACSCGEYEVEKIPPLGHESEEFVCTVCGQVVPEAPVTEGLVYSEITEDGETAAYCVTGITEEYSNYIKIPSEYNGKPVTVIGKNAFYNCENVKSVFLGDEVEVIGELAFADSCELDTVRLGDKVKIIDEYAFSQCFALKRINIPSSVVTIGECAFVSCESLENIILNDGLESIGVCAFAGCSSLTSFKMPNSVKEAGYGVLMFQMGSAGFGGESSLSNKLTELVISDSLTEIMDSAFSKCNISSVEIGKSVETIRYSAFYGCELLESIVVPKSVTKIESYAFYQCSALKRVFYEGTPADWNKITIGKNGNDITDATRYYYLDFEPGIDGNFWHYVDGVPVIW